MSSWFFAVYEGLRSLWRHRFVGILSILTIAAALFVLGFFITVTMNLHSILSAVQEKISVELFLQDGTTKADVASLISELSQMDGIHTAEFITKADAMRRFSKKFGGKYLVGLTDNPFPPSILVRLDTGTKLAETAEIIAQKYKAYPAITQIAVPGDVARKLSQALKIFLILSFVWAIILIFGAVLVVVNTVKLAIYGRRDSIEIMQLVGATSAFIQRPFTIEGFFHGLFAGALSAILLYFSLLGTAQIIPSIQLPPREFLYAFILLGIVFGILGSRLAVKKFL